MTEYEERKKTFDEERRRGYARVSRTTSYAMDCSANGDFEGEKIALSHALELVLDLLAAYYDAGGDADAVELDGVREVPRAVQDIPQAGQAQEEGARQAHVVPVVQGSDEAPRAVLTGGAL